MGTLTVNSLNYRQGGFAGTINYIRVVGTSSLEYSINITEMDHYSQADVFIMYAGITQGLFIDTFIKTGLHGGTWNIYPRLTKDAYGLFFLLHTTMRAGVKTTTDTYPIPTTDTYFEGGSNFLMTYDLTISGLTQGYINGVWNTGYMGSILETWSADGNYVNTWAYLQPATGMGFTHVFEGTHSIGSVGVYDPLPVTFTFASEIRVVVLTFLNLNGEPKTWSGYTEPIDEYQIQTTDINGTVGYVTAQQESEINEWISSDGGPPPPLKVDLTFNNLNGQPKTWVGYAEPYGDYQYYFIDDYGVSGYLTSVQVGEVNGWIQSDGGPSAEVDLSTIIIPIVAIGGIAGGIIAFKYLGKKGR